MYIRLRPVFYYFIGLLILPVNATAQDLDSILALPAQEQVMALRKHLFPRPGEDTLSVYQRFDAYESYFRKKGNERLCRQAWVMRYMLGGSHINLWKAYGLL